MLFVHYTQDILKLYNIFLPISSIMELIGVNRHKRIMLKKDAIQFNQRTIK